MYLPIKIYFCYAKHIRIQSFCILLFAYQQQTKATLIYKIVLTPESTLTDCCIYPSIMHNSRVIILLLIMLIIIPLLTPFQHDTSYAIGAQYLGQFLYYKTTDPAVYQVGIFLPSEFHCFAWWYRVMIVVIA